MQIKVPETIAWKKGRMKIIDQTKLPLKLRYIYCDTLKDVWDAIKALKVRGAPAIGVAAGYGVLVGLKGFQPKDSADLIRKVNEVTSYLESARPTAVNLSWALERMQAVAQRVQNKPPKQILAALKNEAIRIHEEDKELCRNIARHGEKLIRSGNAVLTHCNAGALATGGMGTALAPIFLAHAKGKKLKVFADETRPLLQGARLTAWELKQAGINVTLICDNMASQVMKEGKVDLVITGADRIAANGDAANKIGTYGVALAAKAHNIPFFVAAPSSTFDFSIKKGADIPIEQRDPEEITCGFGRQTAPDDIVVYNPAFDVTPARLITALITEKGVIYPPYRKNIAHTLDHQLTKSKVGASTRLRKRRKSS
jgi:methylthioribose-1-phosphate isomerase